MLASIINNDDDFEIFLTDEEIDKLEFQPLKGKIFRYPNLREIYDLELTLDTEESEQKSGGRINRILKNNCYFVYISPFYHKELRDMGFTKNDGYPVKIDIINESIAKYDGKFRRDLKKIKFCYENKDSLIKKITSF